MPKQQQRTQCAELWLAQNIQVHVSRMNVPCVAFAFCLWLKLDVCLSMTALVTCHKDWLHEAAAEKVCDCMSRAPVWSSNFYRQSILEVSYSLTPLDAARVTILYLFCLCLSLPWFLLVTLPLSNTYFTASLHLRFYFYFFEKTIFSVERERHQVTKQRHCQAMYIHQILLGRNNIILDLMCKTI